MDTNTLLGTISGQLVCITIILALIYLKQK